MMRRLIVTGLAVVLGCALMVGCGEGDDTAAVPADQASERTDETSQPDEEETMTPEQEQAIADLADRLEVDKAEIGVARVEDVSWPNGALGCPEPGEMYTQALVDGQRIVLVHDGKEYAYHSGGDRAPFYCANPEPAGD